ncbi:MAG: VTT domain-containing protein [Myxococcales bacterium]
MTLVTILLVKTALSPELVGRPAAALLVKVGVLGPAIFVALLAVRPVLLLPGQAFSALAGVLWGTFEGAALSLVGAALGMVVVTTLGRRLLRRPVARLAGERREELAKVAAHHDFTYALLITLNPLLPTDVCVALGAGAGGRRGRLVLGAVAGSIPGTVATAAFGSALSRGEPVLVTLSVAGVVVSVVGGALLARAIGRELREPAPAGAPGRAAPPPPLSEVLRDR